MVNEVPRRLPPTPEERLKIIATRMAGGSNVGATRWAAPVSKTSNYSPVNATSTPEPTDVGIYTSASVQNSSLVPNPNFGDEQQPNYDASPVFIDRLQIGKAYLVEAEVAAGPVDDSNVHTPGDGLQIWVDGVTANSTITTGDGLMNQLGDDPPIMFVPLSGGQNAYSNTWPVTRFHLISLVEVSPLATSAPTLTLFYRARGTRDFEIPGVVWLRASYAYESPQPPT